MKKSWVCRNHFATPQHATPRQATPPQINSLSSMIMSKLFVSKQTLCSFILTISCKETLCCTTSGTISLTIPKLEEDLIANEPALTGWYAFIPKYSVIQFCFDSHKNQAFFMEQSLTNVPTSKYFSISATWRDTKPHYAYEKRRKLNEIRMIVRGKRVERRETEKEDETKRKIDMERQKPKDIKMCRQS